jgi:WD40 repeat protein
VQGLTWSRDGRQLLISSGSKVFVWDLHRNRQQFVWDAHENMVNKVAVSPTQALAATVGQDFRVNLWSLETGKRLKTMQGHKESPVSAAFGGLGRILVTLGERGEMLFWHVSTGEELFAVRESAIPHADDILVSNPSELIRLGHFPDRIQALVLRTDRKLPWQPILDAKRTTSEEHHEPVRWR